MKCEILFESRPVNPQYVNGLCHAVAVCRTHGVTIEGFVQGDLCIVGRIERLEKLCGLSS